MTMKNKLIMTFVSLISLSGCQSWLMEVPVGTSEYEDYYVSGATCLPVVTACYVPMMWQFYNSTYIFECMIGDVCSDDAFKGGQYMNDGPDILDMENFRVNADNSFLEQFYHAQYVGISRCNRAMRDIAAVPTDEYMDMALRARYIAEVQCLRAFYYMRLVRIFGRVPYITEVIEGSDQLKYKREELPVIWKGIISDLKNAEIFLWPKSSYTADELGRITKGTAQALLVKAYLTGHEHIADEDPYVQAAYWGEQIDLSQEYDLCRNYWDNFSLAGENGKESVFEIQYTNDPTGSYDPYGGTRGTFRLLWQRCRSDVYTSGNPGWGYNRPTQDLYNEYETGDPRRDLTIDVLSDADVTNPQEHFYEGVVRTVSLKYAMMTDGVDGGVYVTDKDNPRGPINTKEIRYADVLLMYAEACVETGNIDKAKELLERVRSRARGNDDAILPAFPGYNGYSDTVEDLRAAIRHERRVELAMEGHRWFDLNRWGVTAEVMTRWLDSDERKEVYPSLSPVFRKGVNEIFPIPAEERRLGGLDQNPGY